MRATTRLLLAAAAALAAIPGGAQAAPACARVDVIVPGPVIGVGHCVPTPYQTRCVIVPAEAGSIAVVVLACHPVA